MADSQERVKELYALMEKGARGVFESGEYAEWLKSAAKFTNYSFNNMLLIYSQKPDATLVMGYKGWQTNFKRQVRKGEKGIAILAPIVKTVENEKGEEEKVVANFTIKHVFDISQTDGPPLPTIAHELEGNAEQYGRFMEALKKASPFPIEFEKISREGVKGYCDFANARIAINEGMSELQTIKTAVHEITHASLHAPSHPLALQSDRASKEVEAESVAYIVCAHYGIDASSYSFGYVAAWSQGKELQELKSSLQTIQKQSCSLIDSIDASFGPSARSRSLIGPAVGAGPDPGKKPSVAGRIEAAKAKAKPSAAREPAKPSKRSKGRDM